MNSLQLGKYAEYLTKMEFVLWGCDVFTSEVDDHGIDFVIRTRQGNHFDVQVKSFRLTAGKRTPYYLYIQKSKFKIHPSLLLVLVHFVKGMPPTLYLLPSCVGADPNPLLESRDYGEGKKSPPEWGLTLSKKKLALLSEQCAFDTVVKALE
ncbi:DUF4365 domain-containing protein [Paludibaculum fermentans]|uniref:DUF4365 domain-containing protein n=1 Tax=Paludibaculum fermentans TaxID=1473598 RepID=UPI003EBE68BD